nr:hypothetical protein [Tanacetum cinerariifolium]
MILESVEQGPLIWPFVEVEGVTRPKKYLELSVAEAIQADCDVKATNIILQGLPPENSMNSSEPNPPKRPTKVDVLKELPKEIDSLKHTLSEYLKEKESFERKITILKDDLQKEESQNI